MGLNIEDQGHPADYVGVSIKRLHDGFYELTQRALIDAIINDVGINDSRTKPVPAKVSLRFHAFKDEPTFDLNFNYRSVVGKLDYLAQTTCPDIMYAVHQIANYSSAPRQSHGEAILYLVRYLKKTRELGIRFKPLPCWLCCSAALPLLYPCCSAANTALLLPRCRCRPAALPPPLRCFRCPCADAAIAMLPLPPPLCRRLRH